MYSLLFQTPSISKKMASSPKRKTFFSSSSSSSSSTSSIPLLLTFLLSTLLTTLPVASAISRSEFYPFGAHAGDTLLVTGDDVSSNEIPLSVSTTFFGDRFSSIFVNNNGHLSFQTEIPNFNPDLNFPNRYQVRELLIL